MRRKFLGFEQQTDSFCTNEREYPLRLNTSQSHFIWWLAARQEMLSSSKYFLNTTKYYPSLNTPFSPGSWGRHTVQRGRRGQQSAPCCLVTPGTDITPVTHAAGPRLASAGPAHMSLTRQLSSGPRAEQAVTGYWHLTSEWRSVTSVTRVKSTCDCVRLRPELIVNWSCYTLHYSDLILGRDMNCNRISCAEYIKTL